MPCESTWRNLQISTSKEKSVIFAGFGFTKDVRPFLCCDETLTVWFPAEQIKLEAPIATRAIE